MRDLAAASEQIELALSYLTDAYELVDEGLADRIEEELFSPVQASFGRARRTLSEFTRRYQLHDSTTAAPAPGARPHGPRELVEGAADALEQADHWIAELQDSMLPVEVGDTELRAGLSETRELLDSLPGRARALMRVFGR